jgi:hypothetical protein
MTDVRSPVAEAMRHRDDDADNRYYKVGLVRGQRSLLLGVLLVCIALILGLALPVDWDSDLGDRWVGFVALVAAFGALGACLSAIQSLGRTADHARIPEQRSVVDHHKSRDRRSAPQPPSAYTRLLSPEPSTSTSPGEEAHLTVLALAFAAGFSERLVVSAVGAATGNADKNKT